MTPTHAQLCTLCDDAEDKLRGLVLRRQHLQRDIELTEKHIIAAQGILAALKVATGEPYDPDMVPFDLACS